MNFLPIATCLLLSLLLGTVLCTENAANVLNSNLVARHSAESEPLVGSGMPKLHEMKALVAKVRNLRKRECLSGILSSNCQNSKTNKEKGAINENNNGGNYKNP